MERVSFGFLIAFCLVFLGYLAFQVVAINSAASGGAIVQMDFAAFWAAAKLAIAGNAEAAFDPTILATAPMADADFRVGERFIWLYPPVFHIFITPLGLLPFTAAYAVFAALSMAVFVWAVAAWLPGGWKLAGIAAASPATWMALHAGNSTLLWCTTLLFALAVVARGRNLYAGGLIGLLTFKPQLGLLIPFCIINRSYWRAALWTVAVSTGIVVLTSVIFGFSYWRAFFYAIRRIAEIRSDDAEHIVSMVSWYSFARILGADQSSAIVAHIAGLGVTAVTLALLWRRPDVGFDIKAACLLIAVPLSTPYAWHYELVMPTTGVLFLVRAGFGQSTRGCALIFALWALPIPAFLFDNLWVTHYAAPALTLCLALCIGMALPKRKALDLEPVTLAPRG